jgi:hypothetical protein
MITGAAVLNVGHDVIKQAMQEYLARHFLAGACPIVLGVDLQENMGAGVRMDLRRFDVRLDPPDPAKLPPAPRASRALDMEA